MNGQNKTKENQEAPKGYEFTIATSVPATPVKDQEGNKFYRVKNSWGTGSHIYKGYHNVSEAYMRA